MSTIHHSTNFLVNTSSLFGRLSLSRTEAGLAVTIRNLSSGLRIHSGRDDPSGFIAANAMRTEIVSTAQAIANSQRAGAVIATADSALGNMSHLLNDLRGIVVQAANTGAETPLTLRALQLEADSVLDAIDRIASQTQFQHQKLLDGSLDFTTYGLDTGKLAHFQISQANFLGRIEKDISVKVLEPATQGELYFPYGALASSVILDVGGAQGYHTYSFDRDATVQQIAEAVNRNSDATGVAATVFSQSTAGTISLTSYGKDNDVLLTASQPGTAAGNFVVRYTAPKEGNAEAYLNVFSSDGNEPSVIEVVLQTEPGGSVLTNAQEVATLINTSPQLRYPDGTGMVSATIPNGTAGLGTVTPFAEYSYYGSSLEKNFLQFLGPAGSPTIRFVSTPGTPLSIDDKTHPPINGNATAIIQGFDAGTSFTVRALNAGPEYDNIGIVFQDSPDESVVFDELRGTLTISVDFTGRPADFSMNDLRQLFADDPDIASLFTVTPQTYYDPADPPTFSDPQYRGINARVGETSGGRIDNGTVLVHLETDANGIIKTTANDLVKFFDSPGSEESQAVLDRLGISVSIIDPTSSTLPVCTLGEAANGTGILKPTYDPNDPDCLVDRSTSYPDIAFTSSGRDVREDFPTATVSSINGLDASFTVTAKQRGAAYNNTTVRIVPDAFGPSVQFNRLTLELTIGVSRAEPTTANEVIALINSELGDLFLASNAPSSTGDGAVAIGDRATLTGGVKAVDGRAEGTVTAANGMHAVFEVRARQTGLYDDTQIYVFEDADGPSVSYDAHFKQLVVGINSQYPPTAREIVDLINATPGIGDRFEAAIPASVPGAVQSPTGEGFVRVGDSGTMRVPSDGGSDGAPMLGNSDRANLGITFHSTDYGSEAFVSVIASIGTEFPLTDRFGTATHRAVGTDVVALINNEYAIGNGQVASVRTSDLDLDLWIDPTVRQGEVFGFRITGGGALMQLGPDAVPWQQSRIGITNTNTVALGGVSGHLSQIRSGGPYDLLTDTNTAFRIVEEVIAEVVNLRGRLGAFQRNQVQVNMDNMIDAVEIMTAARSEITDTDFAAASSELARWQLLMESTVTVLQYSSQSARLLLSLLQN